MFAKFIDRVLNCILDAVVVRMVRHFGTDVFAKAVAANVNANHLAEVVCDTIDMDDVKQFMANSVSASDLAEYIDVDEVADKVDITASAVAQEIDLSDLAGELDYSQIVNNVEIDYSEIVSNLDMSDIGNECVQHLDMEEIASNFNVSEIAGEIELADLAGEIDYEELAKALLAQFAKAQKVNEVRSATT